FLTSSHAKELINSGDHKTARRVVFLTDGTKLCEQILKTIDSGYLKHATVVIDTTWTLLDYLLFKTFRQDLSYIFDLTLLGLRNTCCIVNDHLNVSFPHTSEVLAELSYELILFAKNTPSKPRPFHLKSILEEAHPFQDSNKFFVFSENSNWTSAILFKNQKHFIDFHRILYRRGFGMIPSSVRLLQKGQVIGFYFNNKASHELSKDLDTCMKLRKTIFDTV
ncbi:MAG: hypothetical protein N2654_07120, partial [Deltaproteobacteria bacterium]|nr:hypothetical protein [Deltaproteobacteria bacterium]